MLVVSVNWSQVAFNMEQILEGNYITHLFESYISLHDLPTSLIKQWFTIGKIRIEI